MAIYESVDYTQAPSVNTIWEQDSGNDPVLFELYERQDKARKAYIELLADEKQRDDLLPFAVKFLEGIDFAIKKHDIKSDVPERVLRPNGIGVLKRPETMWFTSVVKLDKC